MFKDSVSREKPEAKLTKQLLHHTIHHIANTNPHLLTLRTSHPEKFGPALFLTPDIPLPPFAKNSHGEIAHIHLDADGTSHVTLSLAIEKGWGCRHGLSGVVLLIGYLMIFAPRDEEEVEVLDKILKARVVFVSGGEVV